MRQLAPVQAMDVIDHTRDDDAASASQSEGGGHQVCVPRLHLVTARVGTRSRVTDTELVDIDITDFDPVTRKAGEDLPANGRLAAARWPVQPQDR